MTNKRTDPHRPSAIDPSHYTLAKPLPNVRAPFCGPFMDFGSVAETCDHCGHAIRYGVRFVYEPTGETVLFGETCTNLIDLPSELKSRIGYEMNRVRIAAANERKKLKMEQEWTDRRARMMTDEPEVVEFLDELPENERFAFLVDMKAAYERFGSLTVNQTNAVKKIMERREEQARKQVEEAVQLAHAPLAPEGRETVQGTIIRRKSAPGYMGGTSWKMLVKLDDGNKVYGSIPRSIEDGVWATDDGSYEGKRVEFTATFTRKEDHFSYYKNPAKGKVL